ncbi:SIMPL domain-containing protein [Halorubrum laminariae]|uniref:SIMPL domain-containing protein n=1 Tax=Halorubrum laminariae TaxID=1433523 RepID=A0ABD6C0J4_9EURY|nr:SIMPL domain-containing protein [Halorubrum laminariae]
MDRRLTVIVGVTLLVALAGCSGLAGSTGGAGSGTGDQATLDESIDVAANGEATASPDRATIRVAVTASGSDAQSVRDDLAADEDSLRAGLTEWGLSEDAIQTVRYDVSETYASRENPNRTQFEGVHQYEIELDNVDAVGEVIDVAIGSGADEVQQIQFGLSEEREAAVREEALQNAMTNARADADVLANASDLTIEGVHAVSTGGSGVSPYRVAETAALDGGDAGDASTGIETGDVSVQVSVNVVYDVQ